MSRRRIKSVLVAMALLSAGAPGLSAQQDTTVGIIERNVAVPMRDGVLLRADVWRPETPGPFPVLVYRTPYSKAPVFSDYGMFRKAVERGYAVVAQDVRGRYASEGHYVAYQQEGKDGYDTIEWAAAQPWSNGSVGTFGLSYPGAVQWLAAVENPPHLKAMAPAMTFASPMHFWYVGGVWDNSWILWVWSNIAPDLRARRDLPGPKTGAEARAAWQAGGSELQFQLPLATMPAFRGIADWYYDWMTHPPGDPWWSWAELTDKYQRTNAAVLNISGWHDEAYGPAGATTNFAGLVATRGGEARAARTRVVIGPWTHGVGSIGRTRSGDREMGPNAVQDYDELVLRWMDRWVRGIENGVDQEPPVRVYLMGADRWLEGDRWPLPGATSRSLYLGRAAGGSGVLSDAPPPAGVAPSAMVSDPAHPVRDPFATESGPHDYRALVGRSDVMVFETAPLAETLDVAGAVEAEIHLSVDRPDTDLWVKLFDVAPDGTAFNLMSPGLDVMRASYRDGGPIRKLLTPGQPVMLRFSQLLTAHRFRQGPRLRVALMTSFAPHFSRNLHTGALEMESAEGRVARVTVHHDATRPSRLILPVIVARSSTPAADALAAPPLVAQPPHESGPIEGVGWRWVGMVTPLDVVTVPNPERYTLRLEAGRMSGQADCNRISGSYTLEGKSLTFGPLAMTRAMCPAESLGDKYAGYFEWIRNYFTVGDTLYLDLMADGGTLRFVKRP